jgi:hypothetical protein
VAFQAGWLATVLGAAKGLVWLGPLAVLAAIVAHATLASRPGLELRLLLAAAAVGLAVENTLLTLGLVHYAGDPVWVPLWMVALWPLFATTLNLTLAWLKPRLRLATVAGALAGPLAYAGGEALGAITLHGHALMVLALVWAAAFPALLALARRWDGCGPGEGRP